MKPITLEPWVEACGTLSKVIEEEARITLDFGKFQVRLGSIESAAIKSKLNDEMVGTSAP